MNQEEYTEVYERLLELDEDFEPLSLDYDVLPGETPGEAQTRCLVELGILPQKENNLPKFKIRPIPVLSLMSVIVISRRTKLYIGLYSSDKNLVRSDSFYFVWEGVVAPILKRGHF